MPRREHMMQSRQMDLNLLRIFEAVVTERNVTRAAKRLNMTQPAVSNALNRLRDVVKDELFIKHPGGVLPTAKAEAMWPEVRDALRHLTEAVLPSAFEPETANYTFRISASDYIVSHLFGAAIHMLDAVAPGLRMNFVPHTLETAVPLLESGQIDIAAGVVVNRTSRIFSAMLEDVPYECVMRHTHPLAGKVLSRTAFLRARHLAVSQSGQKSIIDRDIEEQGFQRNIAYTINQFALVAAILRQTDLIAVVPCGVLRREDGFHVTASPIPIRSQRISLLWHERNDNQPAHRWLRQFLIEKSRDASRLFNQHG